MVSYSKRPQSPRNTQNFAFKQWRTHCAPECDIGEKNTTPRSRIPAWETSEALLGSVLHVGSEGSGLNTLSKKVPGKPTCTQTHPFSLEFPLLGLLFWFTNWKHASLGRGLEAPSKGLLEAPPRWSLKVRGRQKGWRGPTVGRLNQPHGFSQLSWLMWTKKIRTVLPFENHTRDWSLISHRHSWAYLAMLIVIVKQ